MTAAAAFAVHVPTAAFRQYSVLLTDYTLLHPEFLPYSPHISAAAVLRFPESEMQSSFPSP